MRKRQTALIVVCGIWLFSELAGWALGSWLDNNINDENLSRTVATLKTVLDVLTSGFGAGFVLGAALFSLWDWPLVGLWLKKQRERFRNKEQDEALAQECDELSQRLYEQAALMERVRNEQHWQAASGSSSEDMHKHWIDARAAEAREEERLRRQLGPRVQRALVQLGARGVKMDLWGFSLSHHDWSAASYFFADLANALRSGTYLEREFKAGRSGASQPARL